MEFNMIIFSTAQGAKQTVDSMEDVMITLKGIAQAFSYYKGQTEQSFITNDHENARMLIKKYKQESYLEKGHYGYWYLIDGQTDKVLEIFKTLKEVSKDTAIRSKGFTELNGRYYILSKY
jgi:hypothetical protein